jgi:ABC-type Mn2+/Zn2+ transport system permease subunit
VKAVALFLENPFAPLGYGFMIEALLVAVLVGTVCAVLSCYLVLKGWSLMGDAVSHAVLPGIVLAYLAGLPLMLGAFLSGLSCALLTGYVKSNSRVKEDTVMGVVFTGMFALGLVLVSRTESDIHLMHILFGSLLGISTEQILQVVGMSALVLASIFILKKDLLLFCFDPGHARSLGLNTQVLHYVFLSLLALTIVLSLQAVGVILVIAMLITPGCVALLLTQRFHWMLFWAISSAVVSCFLGTYLSYFINGATGACIVLIQTLQFLGVIAFSPKFGWLRKKNLSVA